MICVQVLFEALVIALGLFQQEQKKCVKWVPLQDKKLLVVVQPEDLASFQLKKWCKVAWVEGHCKGNMKKEKVMWSIEICSWKTLEVLTNKVMHKG